MRTEMSYLPRELTRETEPDASDEAQVTEAQATTGSEKAVAAVPRLQRVAYYRTGEQVPAGEYTCTYCGHSIHLARERALPLCGSCDTDEFMARRPIAPTRPRVRQLVAA